MALFDIENLTFSYPNASAPALKDINLAIDRSSYVCICGKSGCGKTTLLRHMKTVLAPHGSLRGRVLLDGISLSEIDICLQAKKIGFVMQEPDAQIVTDKVWHELAFGLENLGCEPQIMKRRVAETVSYFGIQNWYHKDISELSGGQKQLLNIAATMVMDPDILILDEPTSQLDPIASDNLLDTVERINKDFGITVIISEQRLERVFAAADKVVVLEDGHVIANGDPRDVGVALITCNNNLAKALPTPMRIFFDVEPNRSSGYTETRKNTWRETPKTGSPKKEVPLTIREGGTWLREYVDNSAFRDNTCATSSFEKKPLDLALQMDNVWFRYEKNGPDILKNLHLKIAKSDIFAVVGGNGTGKTTMLKTICGVLKPYRGKISILGSRVKHRDNADSLAKYVAMLPQNPKYLLTKLSVSEELKEMVEDTSKHEADTEMLEVAKRCDIMAILDRHPLDLSSGELQRVGLAKALLSNPKILLLDEPTKGLDCIHEEQLATLLKELTAQGITVILVSHDIEFCAKHATNMALFFDGSIVSAGASHDFLSNCNLYTTAARKMSRGILPNAVLEEDVINLCLDR